MTRFDFPWSEFIKGNFEVICTNEEECVDFHTSYAEYCTSNKIKCEEIIPQASIYQSKDDKEKSPIILYHCLLKGDSKGFMQWSEYSDGKKCFNPFKKKMMKLIRKSALSCVQQ